MILQKFYFLFLYDLLKQEFKGNRLLKMWSMHLMKARGKGKKTVFKIACAVLLFDLRIFLKLL